MLTSPSYTRTGRVKATVDGVPLDMPADHPLVLAHLAGNGSITAYVAPPAQLLPYQAARKAGYVDLDIALGKRPEGASGSAENTAGHVTDATLTMLETIRIAAGVPATTEWAALVAAVTAIKIANPKPE